jgi:VWFA-related protein
MRAGGELRAKWLAILAFLLTSILACGQSPANPQSQPNQKTDQQNIPDAPSAVRPPQPFPAPAATGPTARPSAPLPANEPAPGETPASQPGPSEAPPQPAPPVNIKTVPQGGATEERDGASDELFKITRNVNQVLVPVRVTSDSGRMIDGLVYKDFAVYEDGKKQPLNFFTSDPFALSAAIIFDLGMPDAAVEKVKDTFAALEGSFSQYDEVALYTYSNTVGRMADFGAVGQKLDEDFNRLKMVQGRNNGPPITGGPMGPQGATVNGIPVDPNVPHVMNAPQESHVLNDAILQAALDLRKRDNTRRKIIFVISDGREIGSTASYSAVLKVLLTDGIAVYGIGVGGASIPGYGRLQRLHLPRRGYGDILPKYANATAGEFFPEISRDAIETAYSRTVGDARNQYTLGYQTRSTVSEAYRQIEVTVDRPDLKVFAKDGYYPAPPRH